MATSLVKRQGMELVDRKDCIKPIPKFLVELPWGDDENAAVEDIALQILYAESVEEVLSRRDSVEMEQLVGVPITVHSFKLNPSKLKDGIGAFAVIDFTYQGNAKHQVTSTSALGVLAQLARIWQLDGFPFDCAPMEIDTGNNGKNNPIYLAPAALVEPL